MSEAAQVFARAFGGAPAVVADAPGRVNLIGEHTDYNHGYVLPVAIPQRTSVALAARPDDVVRLVTAAGVAAAGDAATEYRLGHEHKTGGWSDYVQGCTAMLAARGYRLTGFDAAVVSDVPVGAGLSSSAALEVSVLRGLRTLNGFELDDLALALVAHAAEHDFVGARVGVMDQMAASLADESTALFLDARSGATERVPLPASLALAVIDSGVAHRHAGGGYNARRAECERAAELLGVASLREVEVHALERAIRLPAPLERRVRHVVMENARVLAAVEALRQADLTRFGTLLGAAQASLRDDFEVSTPEIDSLVALAEADPDVAGARMTGGGFGGAVVLAVTRGRAAEAAKRVVAAYARQGGAGRVLLPRRATAERPA